MLCMFFLIEFIGLSISVVKSLWPERGVIVNECAVARKNVPGSEVTATCDADNNSKIGKYLFFFRKARQQGRFQYFVVFTANE